MAQSRCLTNTVFSFSPCTPPSPHIRGLHSQAAFPHSRSKGLQVKMSSSLVSDHLGLLLKRAMPAELVPFEILSQKFLPVISPRILLTRTGSFHWTIPSGKKI